MKLIMEAWREYLNVEKNKIHPKILELIEYVDSIGGDPIHIWVEISGAKALISFGTPEKSIPGMGFVSMIRNYDSRFGNCLNTEQKQPFSIQKTEAIIGGPILYDIAIEIASMRGSGLMPDRYTVTSDARGVWEKYVIRDDVDKQQLDIDDVKYYNPDSYPQLTPNNPEDDCHQKSSIDHLQSSWSESPLSKLYSKQSMPVYDFYNKQGRLRLVVK